MPLYADIVFPAAVRRVFTYRIPEQLQKRNLKPGIRVWVPFQKHKAIGMVVDTHDREPAFQTRLVEKILDEQPILSEELLWLTRWISRFYYCGWGEAVQSALPVGLNFYSERQLRVAAATDTSKYGAAGQEILGEVEKAGGISYKEARKRWSEPPQSKVLSRLISKGALEIWEEPALRMEPNREKRWSWKEGVTEQSIAEVIGEHAGSGNKYKWIRALELLRERDLPEWDKTLRSSSDLLDSYTLNRISETGLIEADDAESFDLGLKYDYDPSQLTELTDEQAEALEAISNSLLGNEYASFLLYGITGSGKTEVYIHALKRALEQGRGGLVLVPEIGLTPQIVRRFYRVFGDQIAVLHSRLSDRERYDAWRALHKGKKKIAIGARSAVFAPVRNLGLIIVDEEHDTSYKQTDPAPRYHARDTAVMRATHIGAVAVLGSATPSMVALHGTRKGKSSLLSLRQRPLAAKLPEVRVLDMKQYRSAMRGPLALPLYDAVAKAVERDEQAILLYNRRGYASFLRCDTCGHIPECPNCSVSLTYHKPYRQLRCHYCGYSARSYSSCKECGGELKPVGSGTQQLEEELEKLYADARILRMDFDTTSGKNAHDTILSRFAGKEADLLVGTQIVGKGLDFPDVTVVGVIHADTELAFPSFRSGERMFQLLCQVAGRSGRSSKKGVVFFQTWQPDHPAVRAARQHNYRSFAKQELSYRKKLSYPPFSRLIRFTFKGKSEEKVRRVADTFSRCLTRLEQNVPVLGPSPAALARIQKYYLWETLVKLPPGLGVEAIERLIDQAFELYDEKKSAGTSAIRINVDVDAIE